MDDRMRRRTFLGALAAAALGAPARLTAQAPRSWAADGVVRAIRPERRSVTIHHEDVPGLMPSMTMPFSVEDLHLLDGLEVGQHVHFTFTRTRQGRFVLRSIRRIDAP